MIIAIIVLVVIIAILVTYIIFVDRQLISINKQLHKRLMEHTRQPIGIELISKKLNELAGNINESLKEEENLRINSMRAEKQFREMIANISHDLRTPLTAIKGYQQLMENGELPEEERKYLTIAQKHASELSSLIESFFEYAYLLSIAPEPDIKAINVSSILTECLVASIPEFEEAYMRVSYKESKPVYALADTEMITRCIHNLLRNCVQHGSGEVMVTLEVMSYVTISIKNHVKSDKTIHIEQIFDRFYTSDMARRDSTGLGLSIVKLLVEQMGGTVSAVLEEDMLDIRMKLLRPKSHDT
jgi:signal transduction histidine kinase